MQREQIALYSLLKMYPENNEQVKWSICCVRQTSNKNSYIFIGVKIFTR